MGKEKNTWEGRKRAADVGRSIRVYEVMSEVEKKAEFKRKLEERANNVDTNIRIEIQKTIIDGIKSGKSKEKILEELSQNENYKKHEIHFSDWIDHQSKKVKIKEDDQER